MQDAGHFPSYPQVHSSLHQNRLTFSLPLPRHSAYSLACACQVPALEAQFHGVRTACTTSYTAAPRLPEGAPGPALCHQHRTCSVHASLRGLSLCQECRPLYRHPASHLLALTNSAPGPSPWETVPEASSPSAPVPVPVLVSCGPALRDLTA